MHQIPSKMQENKITLQKNQQDFMMKHFLFCKNESGFIDFLQEKAKVDVLVAVQPVISDGRLAPVLAQQWNQCIVLWATPEEQTGEMISGNSLVTKHFSTIFPNLKNSIFRWELI